MDTMMREATRLQQVAFALLATVTLGWMAGVGLGFAVAASDNASFVADTSAWLPAALQGVLAIAIIAVVVSLLAIIRRIHIRAHVLSEALPRLLQS